MIKILNVSVKQNPILFYFTIKYCTLPSSILCFLPSLIIIVACYIWSFHFNTGRAIHFLFINHLTKERMWQADAHCIFLLSVIPAMCFCFWLFTNVGRFGIHIAYLKFNHSSIVINQSTQLPVNAHAEVQECELPSQVSFF